MKICSSSSSVPAAALGQDAARLGELGRGDVEQGRSRYQSEQRQRQLQLVQQRDGDDAVAVKQPMAEQNHQALLLHHQSLKGLRGRGERAQGRDYCWVQKQTNKNDQG